MGRGSARRSLRHAGRAGIEVSSNLAFVALGSNLGDSPAILMRAMGRLEAWSAEPLLRSSLWQTAPVDCPPNSPLFVNAMVGLKPRAGESPETLLDKLQGLETEFGRRSKTVLNEPRPLDLDLIAFGSRRRHSERLCLPHPRAHERLFVLAPLGEIAPNLVIPGQTKTVRGLLKKRFPGQKVELLRA